MNALFYASTVYSSVSYLTILSLQLFHCFMLCLLRHHIMCIYSRFTLFHYLLRPCRAALFEASTVSSSVPYVTVLSLQGFNCFIICLLRHCHILGFAGPFLCIFLLGPTSPDCLCKVSIVLLSVYYSSALFQSSTVPSSFCYSSPYTQVIFTSLYYLFILQCFHCFITCIRHRSVLGFDCYFLC